MTSPSSLSTTWPSAPGRIWDRPCAAAPTCMRRPIRPATSCTDVSRCASPSSIGPPRRLSPCCCAWPEVMVSPADCNSTAKTSSHRRWPRPCATNFVMSMSPAPGPGCVNCCASTMPASETPCAPSSNAASSYAGPVAGAYRTNRRRDNSAPGLSAAPAGPAAFLAVLDAPSSTHSDIPHIGRARNGTPHTTVARDDSLSATGYVTGRATQQRATSTAADKSTSVCTVPWARPGRQSTQSTMPSEIQVSTS